MKKFSKTQTLIIGSLSCLSAATLVPLAVPHGTEGLVSAFSMTAEESPKRGHKPGIENHYSFVSKDETMDDGSGKSIEHVCAGRELMHRQHVDVPYISRNDAGELAVFAVNGSQVRNLDDVCVRLAPDSFGGVEKSRVVVPDDPEWSFLGTPGSIVWNAPGEDNLEHRPIWPGMGAFDPTHEYSVPTDFVGNSVDLTLEDFKGPGQMVAYSLYGSSQKPTVLLSSTNHRTRSLEVGGHGHMNWAFSKPGIYELTFVVRGRHFNGETEESKPYKVYWLVGSDEDVQLAAGTTKGLSPIGTSAEAVREKMKLPAPSTEREFDQPDTVTDTPNELNRPQLDKLLGDSGPGSSLSFMKDATIPAGRTGTMEIFFEEEYWRYAAKVAVDGKPAKSNKVVVEVPDSQLRCIQDGDEHLKSFVNHSGSRAAWMSAAEPTDTAAALQWDFTGIDFSQFSAGGITVDVETGDAPTDGQVAFGFSTKDGFVPVLQPGLPVSRPMNLLEPKVYKPQMMFSHPGLYKISYSLKSKEGETYKSGGPGVWYVVGNEAINRWRSTIGADMPKLDENPACSGPKIRGVNPRTAPLNPEYAPADSPTDTAAPVEPNPGGGEQPQPVVPGETTPAEPSQPSKPAPTEKFVPSNDIERELLQRWAEGVPVHVVRSGHMDLAVQPHAEGGFETMLRSDENPGKKEFYRSGEFAFRVPSSATVPGNTPLVKVLPEVEGAFYLPQTQQAGIPWVGFSNTEIDHAQIPDTMSVRISDFEGPGRFIAGHLENMGNKWVPGLDSSDQSQQLSYSAGSHDHLFEFFTKEGLYTITFQYEWTDASGKKQSLPLTTSWLVGDSYVDAGSRIVHALGGTVPGPGTEPVTDTTTSPSPEETTEETTPAVPPVPHNPEPVPTEPKKAGEKEQSFVEKVGTLNNSLFELNKQLARADKVIMGYGMDNTLKPPAGGTNQAAPAPSQRGAQHSDAHSAGAPASAPGAMGGATSGASGGSGASRAAQVQAAPIAGNQGGSGSQGSGGGAAVIPLASAGESEETTIAAPADSSETPQPEAAVETSEAAETSQPAAMTPPAAGEPAINAQVQTTAEGEAAGSWLRGLLLGVGAMSLIVAAGVFIASSRINKN